MRLLGKRNKLIIVGTLIVAGVLVGGVVLYFTVWSVQKERPFHSKGDLSAEDFEKYKSYYDSIFTYVVEPGKYKEDPIGAFEGSIVSIDGGKMELVQEDWAVARFWDLIFASYLLGAKSNNQQLIDKATSAREFLYENAIPFKADLSSKTSDNESTYMSNNKFSTCYPLKYPDLLSDKEISFFKDSCISQYSDPDWTTIECHLYGDFLGKDLRELFEQIKEGNSEAIENIKQEEGFQISDRGDKAVDFFILEQYSDDLIPLFQGKWDDLISEVDYETYGADIETFRSESLNPNTLPQCLRTRGYREIAATLIYIFQNKIISEDKELGEKYIGFLKTPTYSLISTLEYLRNSNLLDSEDKKLFSDISKYLIEQPNFLKREYGYYHGMKDISLAELCLTGDDSNVKYLDEIWQLSKSGEESDNQTACYYVDSVVKNLLENGYCVENGQCYNSMLFDEPYEGEDGIVRFSGSSFDTFRLLFDLILIDGRYEN